MITVGKNRCSLHFFHNQATHPCEDGFRLQQVLKSTAAENHPERHFGCGNRQTLLAKGHPAGDLSGQIRWGMMDPIDGQLNYVFVLMTGTKPTIWLWWGRRLHDTVFVRYTTWEDDYIL